MRPTVLVSGPEYGGLLAWTCIRLAVYLAGGRAVRCHAGNAARPCDFDALILSGGSDIHPKLYGQHPLVGGVYDEARDNLERALFLRALSEAKPVLGICRGMQMLNCCLEGTLHQEVADVFPEFLPASSTLGKILARHEVRIVKGSRLAQIIGASSHRVNSLHHQALDRVGHGLSVTATSHDGLIQAVEYEREGWILGVQWHPEYMLHDPACRRIFKALLAAV